ncbi:hypothetical protein INR49_023091 [Caranx melampygus]|nr:hypothetical protein INR49_023091 [Caranx melampygus]
MRNARRTTDLIVVSIGGGHPTAVPVRITTSCATVTRQLPCSSSAVSFGELSILTVIAVRFVWYQTPPPEGQVRVDSLHLHNGLVCGDEVGVSGFGLGFHCEPGVGIQRDLHSFFQMLPSQKRYFGLEEQVDAQGLQQLSGLDEGGQVSPAVRPRGSAVLGKCLVEGEHGESTRGLRLPQQPRIAARPSLRTLLPVPVHVIPIELLTGDLRLFRCPGTVLHNRAQRNTDMKNRGGGWVDSRLRQRVEQYLESSKREYVDLSAMAQELQRLYRVEYGRRNKTAFRIQVEKVYEVIMKESDLSPLESRHLAKRAKHSHDDGGDGSSSSSGESSDSDDHVLENTERAARSSHPPPSAGTQVSTGGWFIDRGRGPEKRNILIDLCDEEPANTASNTVVSLLEPEKSHSKSKKRTKNSTETTEAPTLGKKAKSKSLELQYPTLKFEDVGGNDDTLTDVCKLLVHMRHPEVYQHLGMVPPRGFLLHGPLAVGRLCWPRLWLELQLPMLKVSAPELVSGVSGESEQKLRELFDLAVSSAPCILFIDEIDAITPKREVASKDMEKRIVAQLLTCMDGTTL